MLLQNHKRVVTKQNFLPKQLY